MTRSIGIYSGTFNPVHQGHISFALQVINECSLEEVVFLPDTLPRGKVNVPGIANRLDGVTHALLPYLNMRSIQLTDTEFTVAGTLPTLEQLFPDTQLTFLIGSDVVCESLSSWPGLNMLLSTAALAVGMRDRNNENDVKAVLDQLYTNCNIKPRYRIISTPHAHLASSQFRGDLDRHQ